VTCRRAVPAPLDFVVGAIYVLEQLNTEFPRLLAVFIYVHTITGVLAPLANHASGLGVCFFTLYRVVIPRTLIRAMKRAAAFALLIVGDLFRVANFAVVAPQTASCARV